MSLTDRDYKPILDAFFVQPNILVKHHIESYNNFINYDIKRISKQFDNYTINIERNTDNATEDTKKIKYIRVIIKIHDIHLQRPRYNDSTDKERVMFPNMTRNQGLTYQSQLDVNMSYTVELMNKERQNINTFYSEPKTEKMGYIPVMLKSNLCNLYGFNKFQLRDANEDPYDYGAYFIVKGTEKYIVPQESRLNNYVFMFKNNKEDGDYSVVAEVKSNRDDNHLHRASTVKIKYIRKNDEIVIAINPGFANKDIPITIMFRALGIETDKEIAKYCVGNMDDLQLLKMIRPSLLWSKKERSGAEMRYQTRADGLLYLAQNGYLVNENTLRDKPDEMKQKYIMGQINKYFFPHIIDDDENLPIKVRKAKYLGFIIRNVLLAKIDQIPSDNRDDLGNKRIDLSGPLLSQIYRFAFSDSLKKIQTNISKEFQSKPPQSNDSIKGLIERNKNENTLMSPFKSSLSTGLWKTGASKQNTRNGVSQILQRKSRIDTFSNLRKIYTPSSGSGNMAQIKLADIRQLHTSQYGYIDPLETPDGSQTGVVKHMAGTCHISLYSDPVIVIELLETLFDDKEKIIVKVADLDINESWKITPILINGDWKYSTNDPKKITEFLRTSRRQLKLEKYTEIIWNIDSNEIRIMTDAGRCLRPLFIVDGGNKLLFGKKHLEKLTDKNPFNRWSWDDLFVNGLLEYVGTHESEFNAVIAMYPSEVYAADGKMKRYSHCEIHPLCMMGGVTGLIPFSEHNQAPRNLFQGSMAKQSIDIYSLTYSIRMDTVAHVLHYPHRPLCTTYMADAVDFNTLPAGMTAMVAIAMYSGYNQEDSVILNKSSVERGLFNSTTYKSYKDEAKNDEKFTKPDKSNTMGMDDHANYDKLNMYGIVPVGTVVYKDDILIGKVATLDRAERNGQIDQKDISIAMKEECAIVDQILTDTNDDGYEIYKVKIRILKIPQIGDKCCLTDDHDVLTEEGWKPINEITVNDKVATLKDDKFIEYNNPNETFSFDHEGDMYSIKSQQIDLLATLNHKMYVKKSDRNDYELIEVKNIIGKEVNYKNTKNEVKLLDKEEKIIQFKGKVYCINVPNHVFYVRRNDKCCWTGNSSRMGQKGICGMMYNQHDMPFTSNGITPDLIMNPQALPSRMTLGQLMEVVTGKASAMNGTVADATPFTGVAVEQITESLKSFGFEEYGTEEMYNGFTGKKMETRIFFGPTYYQRLKHMVAEKMHARASGRVQMLTRQPLEGRAREGGLRFGEMERDAMIGHGASVFLKERFYECSDKYEMYICDTCGHPAYGNVNKTLFRCITCDNEGRVSRISKIKIPYASKLLMQEITSMGISMRTFPEKYITN